MSRKCATEAKEKDNAGPYPDQGELKSTQDPSTLASECPAQELPQACDILMIHRGFSFLSAPCPGGRHADT